MSAGLDGLGWTWKVEENGIIRQEDGTGGEERDGFVCSLCAMNHLLWRSVPSTQGSQAESDAR